MGQGQNTGMLEFFNLENICTRTRDMSHITTHCQYVPSSPQINKLQGNGPNELEDFPKRINYTHI